MNTNRLPGDTILPDTGMTFDEARQQLTALHFAKEALSDTEREVLHIAEGLLRLVDPVSYGVTRIERLNGEDATIHP